MEGSLTTAPVTELPSVSSAFTTAENEAFKLIQEDVANFETYEKDFQEVLMTLENDDVLAPFRAEYAGLHHSFLKSHEGEGRLLRKCLDLQMDIHACVSKAQTAEELTRGDRETMETLRQEIDRTRKKVDATNEREVMIRGKIEDLKRSIVELEKINATPVEATAQEAALQSLIRVHETVLKEKEVQEYHVGSLQFDITAAERRLQKLMEGKTTNDTELRAIREAIESKQEETAALLAQKNTTEEKLHAVRDELTRLSALSLQHQKSITQMLKENENHTSTMQRTTAEIDTVTEIYQTLCRQLQQANAALQDCNEENDQLQKRVRDGMRTLNEDKSNVSGYHREYRKQTKLLEALTTRNTVAHEKKAAAECVRRELLDELSRSEEQSQKVLAQAALDEKRWAAVHRELDILHLEHLSADQQSQRNKVWLAEKTSHLHHVEHELAAIENYSQGRIEKLYQVSRECARYEAEAKGHAMQCATLLSEIHGRDAQIAVYSQQVRDVDLKMRQQQSLLDAVISERNAYAKHHGQLRQELAEKNKRFQLLLLQIQQVKDDIMRKERQVLVNEEESASFSRQQKDLEAQIIGIQRRIEKRNRSVDTFNQELRKLGDVLVDATDEVSRQRRRCAAVVHERDLLSVQSMERSTALTAYYEQIHVQQSLLLRAEHMYRERVQHLGQLEFQIAKLEQQLEGMRSFVARLPELRVLINTASRERTREQVKVRSLMDCCEKCINIHPDRPLAWSDPAAFALTERVRDLQRELTQRSRLLQETEAMIAESEQVYLHARATVARQPGPEVAEQLSAYQASLVKKQTQLKHMQASLAFFREQAESFRGRHDELRAKLSAMAKTYASTREEEERRRHPAEESAGKSAGGGEAASASGGDAPLVYAGFVAPPPQAGSVVPPIEVSLPTGVDS